MAESKQIKHALEYFSIFPSPFTGLKVKSILRAIEHTKQQYYMTSYTKPNFHLEDKASGRERSTRLTS